MDKNPVRSKLEMKEAKRLLRKPAGPLEPLDLSLHKSPYWMTRCYRNNRYTVMIDDNAKMTKGVTAIKAMVQRHDGLPIPNHWAEMQKIKNSIFGLNATAIEYYPPVKDLVDNANIYWLWVLPDSELPIYKEC